MKRILTALALLSSTAAMADTTTLHTGKYWATYYVASNSEGKPMCLVQGTWTFRDGAKSGLMMKFTNDSGLFLHLTKSNWSFEPGLEVPLSIWFDRGARDGSGVTMKEPGGTPMVGISVPTDQIGFVKDFAEAKQLTIQFKSGNEPNWIGHMEGSRDAVGHFVSCIVGIGKMAATSPVAPKGTSPVAPRATSPVAPKAVQPTRPMPPVQPTDDKRRATKDDGSV